MTSRELYEKLDFILINSEKPSVEIKNLMKLDEFDQNPFVKIKDLENIEQNPTHHPEGNVLNHTLLVVDNASKYKEKSKDKRIFMWAALLHDLGKLTTTKERKGRITAYNHDLQGEILARELLNSLTEDENFINNVCNLVKFHMQPLFYDKKLPFFKEKEIIEKSNYKEISLLSLADRLGRGNLYEEKIRNEKKIIKSFKNYLEEKYN